MQLVILSDTHIPGRTTEIPAWVREHVVAADHVIHAGDFDSAEGLATVRELADGDLTAVAGNTDPPELDLPPVATLSVEGVTFVVTHGDGARLGYEERVAAVVREAAGPDAIGVAGHTHDPADEVVDGVRLLNPGSATGARPASEASFLAVSVSDGDVDVTLHRE